MHLYYSIKYEPIIYALEYYKLNLKYELSEELKLRNDNKEIKGLKNILKFLNEEFNLNLSEIEIEKCVEYFEMDLKQILKSMSESKDIEENENDPSFLEILLFFMIHKSNSKQKKIETEFIKKLKNKIKPMNLEFENLEIRTGKIIKIWDHPNADNLYVENVDFGDKILQIVSGLRDKCSKEELLNNYFLFMVNLKKSKLRGEISEGMILCAKGTDKTKPIPAPVNKMGEYLYVGFKKIPSNIKKIEKSDPNFNSIMNDLVIKNFKMVFRGYNVMCDDKDVCSDVVSDGIVC